MKNDSICPFEEQREDVLVSYVYDELAEAGREAFEAHLPACAPCRTDLAALSEVRADLAGWVSPEPMAGVGGKTPRVPLRLAPVAPQGRWVAASRQIPGWVHAAAAVLLFAAGLGLANLRVSYTQEGVLFSTGWMHRDTPAATAAATPGAEAGAVGAATPWRADLVALEQSLRREMVAQHKSVATAVSSENEAFVRRVRALIVESEQRQQRELALRVAQVAREAQVQRQADLVKIDRSLGLIQSRTGVEVMRTQQQLNNLAQRVSQRP